VDLLEALAQVIGMHSGHLFILTHQGALVKRFKPHLASILDIDIDPGGDFIATASVDGARPCSYV
jgi:tricorn protease-like protein